MGGGVPRALHDSSTLSFKYEVVLLGPRAILGGIPTFFGTTAVISETDVSDFRAFSLVGYDSLEEG